jgi:Flp pilus assembly protein TadG
VTRVKAARRARDEQGIYLVLFAILIVAMLIMVAIVIDLGSQRQGRRFDRTAVDSAVALAATTLGPGTPNAACLAAMTSVAKNLNVTFDPVGPCSTVPATACSIAAVRTATATSGPFTIVFTNPVLDASPLMKAEVGGGDVAQAVDVTHDGSDPCSRVGLQVSRTDKAAFGGIVGTSNLTSDIHAVARTVITRTRGDTFPALVALDPHGCDVIDANTATIIARPPVGSLSPGIIRTDTDNNGCSGSNVMRVQNSSSGLIEADGAGGAAGGGLLVNVATSNVYSCLGCNGPSNGYYGQRTTADAPITRAPFDTVYRCTSAYLPVPRCIDADTQQPIVDVYNTTIAPLLGSTGTVPTGGFTVLSTSTAPFTCSSPPPNLSGNWYINCPTFNRSVSFLGSGTVVFDGGVDVNQLVFNCATAAGCSTDKLVVIRGNGGSPDLKLQSSGAVLNAPRTTIYQQRGVLTLGGGPTIRWTYPLANPTKKVIYWNEGGGQMELGGNPSITSAGIFFVPNSELYVHGNGDIDATNVQFWANNVDVQGSSARFILRPDPNAALPDLAFKSLIIR